MSTLAEIESAADLLPTGQKEELLRFLVARLREKRNSSKAAEDHRVAGHAGEWLRVAKGSVHAVAGESEDDMRMAYYQAKYGVRP